MKKILRALALASMLPCAALAQQGDTYRETKLGLYASATEAHAMMEADPRAILIDVRDPSELMFTGAAEGLDIHVPWMVLDRSAFDADKGTWPMKRNPGFEAAVKARLDALGVTAGDTIIVMCRSGSSRSAPAADVINAMGYAKVWSVTDGFEGSTLKEGGSKGVRAVDGWRNSGLPWGYKVETGIAWTQE
ncbi:Rhodanese-related sulfurtransferase [Paracoccus halophilus]|uniref:Sulfurtransferase n=1 Tax=Paracoccus halophilus TaxID=376733 RepID=A0A099F4X8_9RHOB|nr:rhodanese-like domain-containing protein [Paracoccus halophilus]KGJ05202.1 sulfurtransferase [Paracoccus halophilus]SFA43574.1 Rhodanese-related sulfurtransferase [Paracoccus halophilus]